MFRRIVVYFIFNEKYMATAIAVQNRGSFGLLWLRVSADLGRFGDKNDSEIAIPF